MSRTPSPGVPPPAGKKTKREGANSTDAAGGGGGDAPRSYGSGARILSIGIASTGLLTFAFFSIASHVLGEESAQRLDVLWSVMFVVISVIYRPIEQLLSRTIAERRARGQTQHPLGIPIAIQASFALVFLAVALALHDPLVNKVFDGYSALYDVLIVGTLAYAASYFARGWLAGHEYFALFGGLVLMESVSRICFVIAAALGITSGQTAVALGIAAAPLVSLVVVPLAFARKGGERHEQESSASAAIEETEAALTSGGWGSDHRGRGGRGVGRARDGGCAGGGGPRRPLATTGHGFCRIGVGDHALGADDLERGGVDRRGNLPK